ncbi:MAG: hypothetical protein ACRD20_20345 [Terriglobales bacterium]
MWRGFLIPLVVYASGLMAQEDHSHLVPEKLGEVSFPISCRPGVQEQFNRGIALLHSFAYAAAEEAFRGVAQQDPGCAIVHWGIAMTHFHQLWDPPLPPSEIAIGQKEIERARHLPGASRREREFISALGLIFESADTVPYRTRAMKYADAMSRLAAANRGDLEAQVFYALALLATASPMDATHAKQKQAVELLEPLYRAHPRHPGIPHYLIHATDNSELAAKGLSAARDYSRIAPSAPHALHMPSHIFTRLGLWDDSIASNLAAWDAAHQQGDSGEELHSMDYLVYAYLQSGQDEKAAQVIEQLKAMPRLEMGDFKVAYAATAMPIRYAVERGQWNEAASITPPAGSPPHVVAIAVWARGLGLARSGRADQARAEVVRLTQIAGQLRTSDADFWATQATILAREVTAWCDQQEGLPDQAASLLRKAADEEDAVEKLPVTPGPILPAREQLGSLLLEQDRPDLAVVEFRKALANAPGRRGALQGAARAAEIMQQKSPAARVQ